MEDSQVDQLSQEESAPVVESVPAPKKGKKSTQKRSRKKSPKKKKPEYNVDVNPETGVMMLQELHYCRLMIAEQKIKIHERDLTIAKTQARDYQNQANLHLQKLQATVKEMDTALYNVKIAYLQSVKAVEEDTGLTLKDWTIDDDRVLRLIDKKDSKEEKSSG